MTGSTILWISDDLSGISRVVHLQNAGFELLTTTNASEAIALGFVNRRIAAIVLDQRGKKHGSFALARILKSIRCDVPILLLSPEAIEPLPRFVDASICAGEELEPLLPVLNALIRASWDGSPIELERLVH